MPEFLPELAEPSTPQCLNLLVEHIKQLTSLDEAKMAERMTTAEMMREHNRMRLERGDSSVSAPASGSENPELAQMAALLDEAGSLLEKASDEAMTVAGTAEQYAMFTATWAVKYYRAEVKKLLVTAVHTGDGDLINVLTSGANRAASCGCTASSSPRSSTSRCTSACTITSNYCTACGCSSGGGGNRA